MARMVPCVYPLPRKDSKLDALANKNDDSSGQCNACCNEFEGLMPDGEDGGGRRDERKAQALKTSRTGDATNDDPAGDEAGPSLVWKGEGNGQAGFSVEDHGILRGG
ncbi:hypothetical protein D7B24_001867 [Verticillium nonalfalfae]|uniref:Uncharacterized protein n=1 Tax=Verticillium nonalfalfae TaxID=1051616 RepID=A0A3M9YKY6_9PEZI|nr:uncharacterized protein D7B24_001867 [Verticillium nonalfalfae]RNJ59690.1 hypothetical protein D7B24_001867 [Verticillium nonalfalfae]